MSFLQNETCFFQVTGLRERYWGRFKFFPTFSVMNFLKYINECKIGIFA